MIKQCSVKSCVLYVKPGSCYCFNHDKINDGKKPEKEAVRFKSQISVWNYIWDTREHVCELSGRELDFQKGSLLWRCCNAHILPKGKYPKFKYLPENHMLIHPDIHNSIDQGTEDQRKKLKEEWAENGYCINYEKFYAAQLELKGIYHRFV